MSQHLITINFVIDTDEEYAGAQEQEEYLRGIGQDIIDSIALNLSRPVGVVIVDTKVMGVA